MGEALLWWNVAFAVVASAVCGGAVLLVARGRVSQDAHWTERARHHAVVRSALRLTGITIPVTVAVCIMVLLVRHSVGTRAMAAFAASLSGACVVLGIRFFEERRVVPGRTFVGLLRGLALSYLNVIWIFGVPAAVWSLGGSELGVRWAVTVGVGVVVSLLWAKLDFVRLLSVLGLALPAPENICESVTRAQARVGVDVHGVWLLRSELANAYAQPEHGHVVFTEAAARSLNPREMEALALHELGHLADKRRASRVFALLVLTILGASRPVFNLGLIEGLLVLVVLLIPMVLVAQAMRRRQEESADATAHDHVEDGPDYARGLEKLYEANLVPAVRGTKGAIYPELYDRQLAAGYQPDYPRPAAPSRVRAIGFTVAILFLCVLATVAFQIWLLTSGLA